MTTLEEFNARRVTRSFAKVASSIWLLGLSVLIAAATPALAQPSDPAASSDSAIDAYVTRLLEDERIPGLALAVIRNGEVIKARGYGYADLEHRVPVIPETVFESGSLGKPFTAILVLSLVEAGLLDLDDPLSDYFESAPASWERMTVRHLLSHTAGLGDYELQLCECDWPGEEDLRRDLTETELLEAIRLVPQRFEPGTAHAYSNTGYALLGLLVREVTSRHWSEELWDRVLEPLGVETAGRVESSAIVPNRATGYRLIEGEIHHQLWMAPFWNSTADGSVHLTILDLAKFEAALHEGRLLRPETLQEMWSPTHLPDNRTAGYGFGWFLAEPGGHRLVSHGGATLNGGFRNFFVRFPEQSLAVAVLTNAGWSADARIALRVAALHEPALEDVVPAPILLAPEALERVAGTYLTEADTFLMPAGKQVSVTRSGEGIRLEAPGRPPLDFLPVRDGRCFLHRNLIELCFIEAAGEGVSGLRLSRLIGGGVEGAMRTSGGPSAASTESEEAAR